MQIAHAIQEAVAVMLRTTDARETLEVLFDMIKQMQFVTDGCVCMRVLAIIPAFNEEESLERTVEELRRVEPSVDFVVINDGSTDRTGEICAKNGYPVVTMPVNCGLTVGFQTGMKYALRGGYDVAVQFDADGQHRPEYLAPMLREMDENGRDIVIGSRFIDEKKGFSPRMIGSRLISLMIRITTGKHLTDPTSGLRMFNRRMIEKFAFDSLLNPEPESIAYLLRKDASVSEVSVRMREREAGESYLSLSKSVKYMVRACTSILFVQWFRG